MAVSFSGVNSIFSITLLQDPSSGSLLESFVLLLYTIGSPPFPSLRLMLLRS